MCHTKEYMVLLLAVSNHHTKRHMYIYILYYINCLYKWVTIPVWHIVNPTSPNFQILLLINFIN